MRTMLIAISVAVMAACSDSTRTLQPSRKDAIDDVAAGKITLKVTYRARAEAICPAVIRAITYHVHVTGLSAGDYDVTVIQTSPDGNGTTTLTGHVKVT